MKRLSLVFLASILGTAVVVAPNDASAIMQAMPNASSQKMMPMELFMGSTGQKVKDVQTALKQMGYYLGRVDGIYGPKTKAAVMKFQRAKHLRRDGIVGKKTLAAMS